MVMQSNEERPAAVAGVPGDRIVHLDVREDLREGREPFSRIMAARQEVPEGGVLCLRAIFEPVPLYRVMERQGFTHHTERLADDDWRVWFLSEGGDAVRERVSAPASTDGSTGAASEATPDATGTPDAPDTPDATDVVVLDVRGLEPPEPMVRTLEALESLPEGHTLLQINVRVPQFLLPRLEERGFVYEIREQAPDLVRVFIRRGD